jgi:hypothetical protein
MQGTRVWFGELYFQDLAYENFEAGRATKHGLVHVSFPDQVVRF